MRSAVTYPYPQSGALLILGAGESGVGAAVLGKKKGFDVMVSDFGAIALEYKQRLEQEGIAFEENGHSDSALQRAVLVVKSPGIPPTAPVIRQLQERNVPIIGEIEFAAQYTEAKIIAITGSNGKSTTTMLSGHILKNAGLNASVAGNIGRSFALQVAEDAADIYVLEISSFMLDDCEYFNPDIAVLLNITPDHLDRYNYQMDNYVASKFRIAKNQSADDIFIYCADDEEIIKGLAKHQVNAQRWAFSLQEEPRFAAYLKEGVDLIIQVKNEDIFEMNIHELSLQGKHNVYNNMASGLIAKAQELRNATMKESMGSYQNIPHRLEFVAGIAGVNYINDSKATNVNSVWYALESFSPGIVLIMGGVDKGNDYSMLSDLIRQKVKAIICIGKDNTRIHEALESDVEVILNSASMKDAVTIASHIAKKGDTVLLSPACASFDWFKNYEDRGDQFKNAVMEL
jgi:UDP-N-acetylmuramoylalanine--D-glutamate ligase